MEEDIWDKIPKIMNAAFEDSGLKSKSDINDIIFVGGGTYLPKVQQIVKEWFDGKYANVAIFEFF